MYNENGLLFIAFKLLVSNQKLKAAWIIKRGGRFLMFLLYIPANENAHNLNWLHCVYGTFAPIQLLWTEQQASAGCIWLYCNIVYIHAHWHDGSIN